MARVGTGRAGLKGRERTKRLRQKALLRPGICIERARLMTESYRETEAEPPVIRRARSLEKILKGMTISIDKDELIVGRATSKQRGAPLVPELNWRWYLDDMDTFATREHDRFAPFTEAEKAKMKEFLPYWEGNTLYDRWRAMLPETAGQYVKTGAPNSSPASIFHLSHNAPDFEEVLTRGLSGVREKVAGVSAGLDITEINYIEKSLFLKAADITLGATISFARRYARLARSMAQKESGPPRKAELARIAEACDRVPAKPARSFYEAVQSVWFTFIALMIEGWGPGLAFGRADQYLYPFYKKDIAEGRLTGEEARELIAQLYIKIHGMVILIPNQAVKDRAGFFMALGITLGGITPSGKDAVNELSYLFLDADEEVRLPSPEITIRVNHSTPDAFLMRAFAALKSLKGKYKFVSDDTAIQQLLSDGKPAEYARDYIIGGCWTPTVPGRADDLPGARLNLPLMLELALNNGISRLTGERMGPATGDPRKFKSYDEAWAAYKKQVAAQIPPLIFFRNIDRQVFAGFSPYPLQSSLFHGCIEKGLDVTAGGTAPYISQSLTATAAPNVGDSLAAIKKAVFEDRQITMAALIDALDRNFADREEIRQVLKGAPKFGNDDDYVDSIVNEVLVHFSSEVAAHRGIAGGKSTTTAAVATGNVTMGRAVGALPDGRRAGEPLSEGGVSPYQGRNVSGPAATMRSVAKLDHLKLSNGSVLNMRFSPHVLKDESHMKQLIARLRMYCETGGFLVHFNFVSTDTLKKAQEHPERYRDLVVRVGTYSAFFTDLSRDIQNDLMATTEFQEV